MLRLTRAQVREVDRLAIEKYLIPGIVLMENAAHAVADAACEMLGGDCIGEILILCGGGNNGGDGLAVARHLHNRGSDVTIALTVDPEKYRGDALINFRIAREMRLEMIRAEPTAIATTSAVLIIDAIFGTGLEKPPREPFPQIVEAVRHSRVPVLAIDLPSGVDCDTGECLVAACIEAARTVTFVAEKAGFANPEAARYLGQVTIGDIGAPHELVEEIRRHGHFSDHVQ
jgi:NAD(P)H-hydrate epimerase